MAVPRLTVVRTPDRPGPGPTPAALLRSLDLTVRRRIEGLLAGEHRAAVQGLGTELAQIRPYRPGDDVRRIDWAVTARTGEPHVRVHVAERALAAWLVLDLSASMTFGTADRRKIDVAEGVAVALGHLTTRRGNRLGVVTFDSRGARAVPPMQGRAGLLSLLTAVHQEPEPDGTGPGSLVEALERTARIARQRALVAVVSDFRGPRDWLRPLVELAWRHDVLAIEIRDPREQELPDVGELWLVDPENGRQLRVDSADRRLRARFATAADDERADLASELRSRGVDHLVLSTAGDWLRPLANFLRLRRGRR
jgi:uncharacterized protein (DUF58 family)